MRGSLLVLAACVLVLAPAARANHTAPSGLTVTAKTHDSVSLDWSNYTRYTPYNYRVHLYNAAGVQVDARWNSATNVANPPSQYTWTRLQPGTSYQFAVAARARRAHLSQFSARVSVTTDSTEPPPPPPAPPPADSDGDGVPDSSDQCPNRPGPASNNGCPVPPAPSPTAPRPGWVENTFPAKNDHHVQSGLNGMYVHPDGTVFTNQEWDEENRQSRVYKNGDVFGPQNETQGRGTAGVVATATDMYVGVKGVWDSGATAVRRFKRSVMEDPNMRNQTCNGDGQFWINGGGSGLVYAMAIYGGELFVATQPGQNDFAAVPESTVVKVYNLANAPWGAYRGTTNGSAVRTFSIPRIRGMSIDRNGSLWVLQQANATTPARVAKFSRTGAPEGVTITAPAFPTAIATDPNVDRILVTDNGTAEQNVKIYSTATGAPLGRSG